MLKDIDLPEVAAATLGLEANATQASEAYLLSICQEITPLLDQPYDR